MHSPQENKQGAWEAHPAFSIQLAAGSTPVKYVCVGSGVYGQTKHTFHISRQPNNNTN